MDKNISDAYKYRLFFICIFTSKNAYKTGYTNENNLKILSEKIPKSLNEIRKNKDVNASFIR